MGSGASVYTALKSTGTSLLIGGGISSDGNFSTVSLAPVSGTVGVGVTAPSAQLDVKGVGDTVNQASLLLRSGNSLSNFNSNQITFGYNAANTYRHTIKTRHNAAAPTGNAYDFYVWKQGTDVSTAIGTQHVMTMDGNANVGIGTTSPSYPLHVFSAAATDLRTKIQSTSTGNHASSLILERGSTTGWSSIDYAGPGTTYWGSGLHGSDVGNSYSIWTTDQTTRFLINSSGNVGIGTTSPLYPLHIEKNGRLISFDPDEFGANVINLNSPGVVRVNGDGTRSMYFTQASDTAFAVGLSDPTPDARFEIYGGGGIFPKFMISSTADSDGDLMMVTAAGNVGIGLAGPGYKLDVNGDVNVAAANVLRFGGTQVCASAGCTAVSDRSLKEDIQPLQNSLDNILKLQGVSYDWKDKEKYGQKQQIGLLAQDLEKIYPQAVITDSKSGLKSVAYDHLVAPLIEAFKELNERIIELFGQSRSHSREIASLKAQAETEKAAKDHKIKALEQENAEIKARLEKIEKALDSK